MRREVILYAAMMKLGCSVCLGVEVFRFCDEVIERGCDCLRGKGASV